MPRDKWRGVDGSVSSETMVKASAAVTACHCLLDGSACMIDGVIKRNDSEWPADDIA
jgi:hypothetical protein